MVWGVDCNNIYISIYLPRGENMTTAKLFKNGQSQAVRLPKEYRFAGDEVGVTRLGDLVVLYPKEHRDKLFFSSLGNFTDDFFDAIESARNDNAPDAPRQMPDTL